MTAVAPPAMREVYRTRLIEMAERDRSIVCLDSDTGGLEDTFGQALPAQYVNLGIAEQNLMSVAAGLARAGRTVYVNTMAGFATMRAAEQLKVDVALANLPVRVVATHSGLTSGHLGPTHWALEDLAVTRTLPHLTIIVPADAAELDAALIAVAGVPGPVYLRLGRAATPPVYDAPVTFHIGRAVRLRPGDRATIVATGPAAVGAALAASRTLAATGVDVGVVNMPTIKPFDAAAIGAAARGSGGLVTVEEHSVHGGLGDAVSEVVGATYPCPVVRVGVPDGGPAYVGSPEELLHRAGVSAEAVVRAVETVVRIW